ncbi:MAG: ATPase, T2SS/T4P/T4SS family, partial [Planctomycetota bacterium]
MPVIEVISPRATHRYPFDGKRFVLGRSNACDAVLKGDHLISREHCEVVLHKGQYVLHDLKSRNGTQVVGKRIDVVRLIDRGIFQVGSTFVRFYLTQASADANPPTPYPTAGVSAAGLAAPTADGAKTPAAAAAEPTTLEDDDEPIYDVAVLVDDETSNADNSPAVTGRPTAGVRAVSGGETISGGGANSGGRATSGGGISSGGGASLGASLGSIVALARVGVDPGFGIESLSLLNGRGQVVHAAGTELTDATESLSHLQLLTLGAIRCNASDIHLEPKQHDALIRLRVDGAMVEVCALDAEQNKKLMSLIKVLCDIDIARKSIIQEGHFSLAVPGRTIDYRVSFAPAMYGQKMVVRVLDPAQSPQQLDDLDMPAAIEERLRSTSQQSTGTVMVCGPTGSGKTTTLYAVLRQIDA